jgi:hypothetical protein
VLVGRPSLWSRVTGRHASFLAPFPPSVPALARWRAVRLLARRACVRPPPPSVWSPGRLAWRRANAQCPCLPARLGWRMRNGVVVSSGRALLVLPAVVGGVRTLPVAMGLHGHPHHARFLWLCVAVTATAMADPVTPQHLPS